MLDCLVLYERSSGSARAHQFARILEPHGLKVLAIEFDLQRLESTGNFLDAACVLVVIEGLEPGVSSTGLLNCRKPFFVVGSTGWSRFETWGEAIFGIERVHPQHARTSRTTMKLVQEIVSACASSPHARAPQMESSTRPSPASARKEMPVEARPAAACEAAASSGKQIVEHSRPSSPPPLPAESRTEAHMTVYFGTNRKPNREGFSNSRDKTTHHGICEVRIPQWHRFGEIRSALWRRVTGFRNGTLEILKVEIVRSREFWTALTNLVSTRPDADQDSVVFIHGYNVGFEEAAIRAAQIGFDLKVPGAMAFFSWPSKGKFGSYPADEASIEAARPHLVAFIANMATRCPRGRLHVIAHSMGNRGLLSALQKILNDKSLSGLKFGQIILAAPDIDADVFRECASCYSAVSMRTTLYACPGDIALQASRWLHEYKRAGICPPVTIVDGVDTVLVPKFNLLDLGHSYFAEAESVLHDMYDTLWHDAAPDRRQRLHPETAPCGGRYWELR